MTEYIMGKGEALPKLCVLHASLKTQTLRYELYTIPINKKPP